MSRDDPQVAEAIDRSLRIMSLDELKRTSPLDTYELELFDWYVRETEKYLGEMDSAERASIKQEIDVGADDTNDSGIVAVGYYIKRVRYSHVIYMASLLETFLKRSCERLTTGVGAQNLPFTTGDLKGDQWSVKRKFLERYGKFTVPDDVWSEIQVLVSLRNHLVHGNGSTSELKGNERAVLANRPGLELNGYEIAIEAEYVHGALEAIEALVQFVETKIGDVIDRAVRPRSVV